ncbi:MAG: HDOD domain-containing protein [Phycisphaeraceae bacterium]|nr:HDOD domain-containing protein [Phycisphaeraceae bacterium]
MTTQNDQSPARRAEQVLGRLGDLPGPPDASAQLLAAKEDSFEPREVVSLIEADASLTPRALAIAKLLCAASGKANSGKDINSIDDVALLAGLSTLRAAVVACQLYDAYAERPTVSLEGDAGADPNAPTMDRRVFWLSSMGVASAAESLASARSSGGEPVDVADAFLAGFAQSLGVLALDSILPRSFARVAAFAEREGKDLAEIERAIMGIDHHTVGRKVAERWQLPQSVRDSIWLAGVTPDRVPQTPHKPVITTVNLASALTRFSQLAWFGDAPTRDALERAGVVCQVDPQTLGAIERTLMDAVSARATIVGMKGASVGELFGITLKRTRGELERQRARETPREKLVERQKAALAAVSAFQSRIAQGASLEDAAGAILESARESLGGATVALCVQPVPGGACRVFAISDAGVRSGAINPPQNDAALRDHFKGDKPAQPLAPKAAWLANDPFFAGRLASGFACALPAGAQLGAALLLDKDPGADSPALRPLLGAWGSALAVVAASDAARDATSRLTQADAKAEQARVAMLEAEGLKSIASLASGATDSFMAQVEMIRTRCEMLAPGLDKQRDQRWLEGIALAGANVGTLVQTLRLFSETPEIKRAAVPLNWVLERASREARGRYKHDPRRYPQPRPRVLAEPNLPNVLVDPEQVIDALAEVIVNGLESEKSEIVEIRGHVDHNTGRALILVRDDGEGVPPDDLPKVFDAYFTTKKKLRRLGLGLTRAKRLIELSAGDISLRADPGGGLAVALFVPLAPPDMEAQPVPEEDSVGLDAETTDAEA